MLLLPEYKSRQADAAIILEVHSGRLYKLIPLSLFLLTMIAFLPALQNGFVDWDDETNFLVNPNYRGLGWEQIHWMWSSHLLGRFTPLTWMTLGLDYTIWGMEPFGYHLTSLLVHGLNAVLFYFLAVAIYRRAARGNISDWIPIAAFFAALLFAVHPLRVESVAWITERRDVVSGFFYLLALLVYMRGFAGDAQEIRRRNYWICLGLFVLALLSKEIAVTLPVVLLILDACPLRRLHGRVTRALLEKVPFLILGLADSALALRSGIEEAATSSIGHVGWFARFNISIYGLAFYIWKTVLPVALSPFYALTQYRVDLRGLPFQLSLAVVLFIAIPSILLRKKIPGLAAVALAYAITLLPVLGIFHNGQQIVADRYSYLACLGWALLAGGAFIETPRMKSVTFILAALMIVTLMYLTWRQSQTWRDSETLWSHAMEVEPSFLAADGLGRALCIRGDVPGCVEMLRQSVELDPNYAYSHNDLGGALLGLEDWESAGREFQIALKLHPHLPNSENGWGYALLKQGKPAEAIAHFEEALKYKPDFENARQNLEQARGLKTN